MESSPSGFSPAPPSSPARAPTHERSVSAEQRKGTTLNDFVLGAELGVGAFSRVVLVTHKATGIKYAMKIVKRELLKKENKMKTIRMERDVLIQCDHENIIKLFYSFSDAENLYLVLELAPGGEMFTYISRNGPLSLEATIFYAAEVVKGLEYLHSQGIIHRDMKPENIIFDKDMHIKITDFGTAKFKNDTSPGDLDMMKTKSKQTFCGTAEYVSPEVLRDQTCTEGSDLWALGCIIYQCLTKDHPFKGQSQYLIFQKILERDIVFPTGFPDVAKDIVDKLLQLDPSKRLGCGPGGYKALKAHPFFLGVDFDTLSSTPPPPMTLQDKPDGYEGMLAELAVELRTTSTPRATPPTNTSPSTLATRIGRSASVSIISSLTKSPAPTSPVSPKPFVGFSTEAHLGGIEIVPSELKAFKVLETWKQFLQKDEKIVFASQVVKRRNLSTKKRNLILTDKPRLFYVGINNFKGNVPWTKDILVIKMTDKMFVVKTPGRDYDFEDANSNAGEWVKAVEFVKTICKT